MLHPTPTGKTDKVEWAFVEAFQRPAYLANRNIGMAMQSVDIAIRSLEDPQLAKALVDAKKRGAAVRLITDGNTAKGKRQAGLIRFLREEGVPVKISRHKGTMNLQMVVLDKQWVMAGSFSFTIEQMRDNDELLITIRDAAVAKAWASEFQRMWDSPKEYAAVR